MTSFIGHILVVDHEVDFYTDIVSLTTSEGFHTDHAVELQTGLDRLSSEKFDIVLLRERLPDGDTADVIERITAAPDAPSVIVFGSGLDPHLAEHMLKCGAWDYIVEVGPKSVLLNSFKNILDYRRRSGERRAHTEFAIEAFKSKGIIGGSPAIQKCLDQIVKAGPSEVNVLIIGESGTGKELFANAVHEISNRSGKEMVVVDCASLQENLVESILFGHVRGAFTGAARASEGLIRQSHQSTLFLDEIGELPLEIQKKFLRVLQERTLRPLGGNVTFPCDFRLIAATNRDIQQMVGRGEFREDLYFRLQTFQITLPPLRNRLSDIPELAYFFMNDYCSAKRLEPKRFSTEFLVVLRRYHWPGNVRELFNIIERSIAAAADSEILLPIHLPIGMRVQSIENLNKKREAPEESIHTAGNGDPELLPPLHEVRKTAIERLERKYLHDLLHRCRGDIDKACKISNVSRSRLYALLKNYHISTS